MLVGLLAEEKGTRVILTERPLQLRDHPGEIGLPGGRVESRDAGPQATALREAFEEIGIPPEKVEIVGRLPKYETVTGFSVHPFVGWIEPPVVFSCDPEEVSDFFLVPLQFVLDRGHYTRGKIEYKGLIREYWELWYGNRRIWGATAAILISLANALTEIEV